MSLEQISNMVCQNVGYKKTFLSKKSDGQKNLVKPNFYLNPN